MICNHNPKVMYIWFLNAHVWDKLMIMFASAMGVMLTPKIQFWKYLQPVLQHCITLRWLLKPAGFFVVFDELWENWKLLSNFKIFVLWTIWCKCVFGVLKIVDVICIHVAKCLIWGFWTTIWYLPVELFIICKMIFKTYYENNFEYWVFLLLDFLKL